MSNDVYLYGMILATTSFLLKGDYPEPDTALLKGMSDEETVRFASACSAVACTRFPLPLNPPKLEEVIAMQQRR